VYSEEDIKEQLQVMSEEGAPQQLMTEVQAGNIPYFTTADGFYEAAHPDASHWVTYEANIIHGRHKYSCALLHNDIAKNLHAIPPLQTKILH
jgi:hypothetical protein